LVSIPAKSQLIATSSCLKAPRVPHRNDLTMSGHLASEEEHDGGHEDRGRPACRGHPRTVTALCLKENPEQQDTRYAQRMVGWPATSKIGRYSPLRRRRTAHFVAAGILVATVASCSQGSAQRTSAVAPTAPTHPQIGDSNYTDAAIAYLCGLDLATSQPQVAKQDTELITQVLRATDGRVGVALKQTSPMAEAQLGWSWQVTCGGTIAGRYSENQWAQVFNAPPPVIHSEKPPAPVLVHGEPLLENRSVLVEVGGDWASTVRRVAAYIGSAAMRHEYSARECGHGLVDETAQWPLMSGKEEGLILYGNGSRVVGWGLTGLVSARGLKAESGLGIGDTIAAVQATYPDAKRVNPDSDRAVFKDSVRQMEVLTYRQSVNEIDSGLNCY